MQARNFYNKCSENSRSKIVFRTDIFRKLTLGAPEHYRDGEYRNKSCLKGTGGNDAEKTPMPRYNVYN